MKKVPLTPNSLCRGKKRVYGDITDEKNTSITVNKGKEKAKDQTSPPPTLIRKRMFGPNLANPSAVSLIIFSLARRAETRPCPVCEEAIPLRLMGRHAQLESERVDQIISQIGSSEPLLLADEFDDLWYAYLPFRKPTCLVEQTQSTRIKFRRS